jgi:hypothetical protein
MSFIASSWPGQIQQHQAQLRDGVARSRRLRRVRHAQHAAATTTEEPLLRAGLAAPTEVVPAHLPSASSPALIDVRGRRDDGVHDLSPAEAQPAGRA